MPCHATSLAKRPASTRSEDVAGFFTGLQPDVLALRGRIVAEPVAPFFITSCDGAAAKILGSQGVSRLTGRRLRSIAHHSCDVTKLEAASRSSLSPHHRAFLSIATKEGRCVPVVVQLGEGTTGRLQLEILLFPASECHPLLLKDVVIDVLESGTGHRGTDRRRSQGRDSPDKDLELVQGDSRDGLEGLDDDWLHESVSSSNSALMSTSPEKDKRGLNVPELRNKLAAYKSGAQ